MADKLDALRRIVRGFDGAVLAYSGGVDSTFLLRVAGEEMGPRLVALTLRSPTAATEEFGDAVALARAWGIEHLVVDTNELTIPGYADNPADRCYHCKGNLFQICAAEARQRGISVLLDGVNLDDLGDYRPGLRAAAEYRVRHPLVEAGLSKDEVRCFSRQLGLPTWDKPASPCLSSRFPYGTRITAERLEQVRRAEALLHRLGFRACRVRHHETIARIEVAVADLPRILAGETRGTVVSGVKALGFLYVDVDLQGLRSGSLNEALPRAQAPTAPMPDLPPS